MIRCNVVGVSLTHVRAVSLFHRVSFVATFPSNDDAAADLSGACSDIGMHAVDGDDDGAYCFAAEQV